jgi:hypothetical protein
MGEVRVRVEGDLVAGRRRKLETRQGPGRDVESEPHRSEDRPLPAERIRRSWEATKCTGMGPIARLGLVVWPGRVVEFGFVAGRAMKLEMGQRSGEKQVPRCARNDNLLGLRRVGVAVGGIRTVRAGGRRVNGSRGCS